MTPFQALYGRPPPSIITYTPRSSALPAVDDILLERDSLLRQLRRNLFVAQQRMRESANRHRRDVAFAVGDFVLLKLQPYRQYSVARPQSAKLGRRYYGPFEVLERIGEVAYRLKLPDSARVHPVFHVSLLRPYIGASPHTSITELPNEFVEGRPRSIPVSAVRERTVLRNGTTELEWLVTWSDGTLDDASWEPTAQLKQRFPDLHLADKVVLEPGGSVTDLGHASPAAADNEPTSESPTETAQSRPTRTIRKPRYLEDYV